MPEVWKTPILLLYDTCTLPPKWQLLKGGVLCTQSFFPDFDQVRLKHLEVIACRHYGGVQFVTRSHRTEHDQLFHAWHSILKVNILNYYVAISDTPDFNMPNGSLYGVRTRAAGMKILCVYHFTNRP